MNILQPYKGRYVSAEYASKDLDINAILDGCASVESEARNISNINNKVSDYGNSITPQALSIDGITVENNLVECCEGINNVESYIISAVDSIKAAAIDAYNKIQSQYNEKAKYEDEQQIQENSK